MPHQKIESLTQVPAFDGYVIDANLVLDAPEVEQPARLARVRELGNVACLVVGHTREEVGRKLGGLARFYTDNDVVSQERRMKSAALFLDARLDDIAYLSSYPDDAEIARRNRMQFVPLSMSALG